MIKITAAQIVAIDLYKAACRKATDALLDDCVEMTIDSERRAKAAKAHEDLLHAAFVAAGGQWTADQIRPWMRRKLASDIADELRAMSHDDSEMFGREVWS